MASNFSNNQWGKIHSLFDNSANNFGLPQRRNDSVVIGTFNIRKLGKLNKRTANSWELLKKILERFDLIAVQEIMDDLTGLEHLLSLLGDDYGMVVSDITGAKPGGSGNRERLGFLFNWKKVTRTALASDITYDRSEIAKNLYTNRDVFDEAWNEHTDKLKKWDDKCAENKALGKKKPSKPPIALPRFVSFIRQPHCVSFRISGQDGATPYEFLVINVHLLYGKNKEEREWEFKALLDWLTIRAKSVDKLYHSNLLLLGDCNLDFDKLDIMREDINEYLKKLNKTVLKSKKAATANFPLLTQHPKHGKLVTALRQKQTYDQIGFFNNDKRLPSPENNDNAGSVEGGYDYGVFNIANLIANALHGKNIDELTKSQRKALYKKSEYDISDHMPAWVRLSLPEVNSTE